jgi:hypothetical protein
MTAELNNRIREYNANPKNEQLKAVSLNYDIENLNSKIIYLRELKDVSIRRVKNQPNTNFTEFFTDLASISTRKADKSNCWIDTFRM